jgi:hypothetical protein
MFQLATVQNEALGWEKIQQLRKDFSPKLFSEVKIQAKSEALIRALETAKEVFAAMAELGIDINTVDPGHARGHWSRDVINGWRYMNRLDADPKEIFIGFVAGVLHDIGNAVVHRYADNSRSVRHAEAAALLLEHIWEKDSMGLNASEQVLIKYAVCAHTHYLKSTKVTCTDGVERTIDPYVDEENGKPIMAMWYPRHIDRLDTNGPCFPGRHYLTLENPHEDFAGEGFYKVDFVDHLMPTMRDKPTGARTMLEHFNMFATSQNNQSAYGKYDPPAMQELRDKYRRQIEHVISNVRNVLFLTADLGQDTVINRWTDFLANNIEPTANGKRVANVLAGRFRDLDGDSRAAWCCGFRTIMVEYELWAYEILNELRPIREMFVFPLLGDIYEMIVPKF